MPCPYSAAPRAKLRSASCCSTRRTSREGTQRSPSVPVLATWEFTWLNIPASRPLPRLTPQTPPWPLGARPRQRPVASRPWLEIWCTPTSPTRGRPRARSLRQLAIQWVRSLETTSTLPRTIPARPPERREPALPLGRPPTVAPSTVGLSRLPTLHVGCPPA